MTLSVPATERQRPPSVAELLAADLRGLAARADAQVERNDRVLGTGRRLVPLRGGRT